MGVTVFCINELTMESLTQKIGKYRWRICALLFFATTINYIDRNVLSFTMIDEFFRKEMLGLDRDAVLTQADHDRFKEMFGYVDAAFKLAYAMGFVIIGYIIDRIGTKKGFSLSIFVWSLAGILNAFVSSFMGLGITRFLLGLGEAGNFPSSIKTVAEWFPRKERSFATGLFNAGANVGIITTAAAVPWITLQFGWRAAFITTGLLGVVLLLVWWRVYRRPEEHPSLSPEELNYIQSDRDEPDSVERVSWRKVLTYKETWAFAIGKFLTDPIWWFYLSWLPDFFNSSESLDQKLDLKNIGWAFILIYLVSDFGSIFFGWVASRLIHMGWSVNKARKVTMLICALCVLPISLAPTVHNLYVAIALMALATAAHQGWSANIFTLTSDMFPKRAVGSVVGVGGMLGGIGGALLAFATGKMIVAWGYMPPFLIAACAYPIALVVIHALAPRLERVKL